jgi:hypothetical protein
VSKIWSYWCVKYVVHIVTTCFYTLNCKEQIFHFYNFLYFSRNICFLLLRTSYKMLLFPYHSIKGGNRYKIVINISKSLIECLCLHVAYHFMSVSSLVSLFHQTDVTVIMTAWWHSGSFSHPTALSFALMKKADNWGGGVVLSPSSLYSSSHYTQILTWVKADEKIIFPRAWYGCIEKNVAAA